MKTLAHRADLDEVLARIRSLAPEAAPRWGRMSVHQAICHMADACRMAIGTMAVASGGRPHRFRKWVALRAPLPWPRGRLATSPELDQLACAGTRPDAFAADVAVLVALVEDLAVSPALEGHEHPVFGRMSRSDWLRWGYLHLDHHLRQFGALRRSVQRP